MARNKERTIIINEREAGQRLKVDEGVRDSGTPANQKKSARAKLCVRILHSENKKK
jgi:hypothetical protein